MEPEAKVEAGMKKNKNEEIIRDKVIFLIEGRL
jgi:hypothetical protein